MHQNQQKNRSGRQRYHIQILPTGKPTALCTILANTSYSYADVNPHMRINWVPPLTAVLTVVLGVSSNGITWVQLKGATGAETQQQDPHYEERKDKKQQRQNKAVAFLDTRD